MGVLRNWQPPPEPRNTSEWEDAKIGNEAVSIASHHLAITLLKEVPNPAARV